MNLPYDTTFPRPTTSSRDLEELVCLFNTRFSFRVCILCTNKVSLDKDVKERFPYQSSVPHTHSLILCTRTSQYSSQTSHKQRCLHAGPSSTYLYIHLSFLMRPHMQHIYYTICSHIQSRSFLQIIVYLSNCLDMHSTEFWFYDIIFLFF